MIDLVADQQLDFAPGTKWSYSNSGYILLGMIIERSSGLSYNDFLKKNVLDPLGMSNSGYDRATDILKERASGYQEKNGRLENADSIDMSVPYAAGDIYSTVEDLYRWNEALVQDGKLLSAASRKQMFTEYAEAEHEGQHYGYGVVHLAPQVWKTALLSRRKRGRIFQQPSTLPERSGLHRHIV